MDQRVGDHTAPALRPRQAPAKAFRARWQEETDGPGPPACCWPAMGLPDVVIAREQIVYLGEGGPWRGRAVEGHRSGALRRAGGAGPNRPVRPRTA